MRFRLGLRVGLVFGLTPLCACLKPVATTGPDALMECSVHPFEQWSPQKMKPSMLFCETIPYSTMEFGRIIVYYDNVPEDWKLSGDVVKLSDITSDTVYLPGVCRLLLDDKSTHGDVVDLLKEHNIPVPPSTYTYSIIDSTYEMMDSSSFVHNFVEVVRAGNQVWLTTSLCGLS